MTQACGHMYLDEGEELSTGIAKDNLLSFSAFTAAGGSSNGTAGQVIRHPFSHLLSHIRYLWPGLRNNEGLACGVQFWQTRTCFEQTWVSSVSVCGERPTPCRDCPRAGSTLHCKQAPCKRP